MRLHCLADLASQALPTAIADREIKLACLHLQKVKALQALRQSSSLRLLKIRQRIIALEAELDFLQNVSLL